MNCLECQELLQRRLDGETGPGPLALEQHLAKCQSCRHTHAAGLLLLEGLKALPPVPRLPADFAQRMTRNVLRDRQHRQARMRRRVWLTVGLAASILLTVWAGSVWLPRRHEPAPLVDGHKTPPTAQPPQHGAAEGKPKSNDSDLPSKKQGDEPAPLARTMDEARSNVVAGLARLADQTKEQARLFVPPMELPSFPMEARVDDPLDPAAQSLLQAGQGVTEGFGTVSRSARRAVSFFMNELPTLDSDN